MSSDDFNRLTYPKKTETVAHGVFLADRTAGDYYIRLYNYNNFYIEVFLDKAFVITKFRAFENTLFVLPYLEELKIAV